MRHFTLPEIKDFNAQKDKTLFVYSKSAENSGGARNGRGQRPKHP
jgi:hypothetical protein